MKHYLSKLCSLIFVILAFSSFSNQNYKDNHNSALAPDEIIFYSHGSQFAPVIVLHENAEILWTWDDNTTSNSATPIKVYGSEQARKNTLKVTPWSAVRRINIGYDAQDGGSTEIEYVDPQYVSMVENIHLVAPYLIEWCSSYSRITSLDFNNFVNLETIECFLCQSLQDINLTNTPKIIRTCFELNSLGNLDYSDCNVLEQVRASSNRFTDITMPENTANIWHLCIRDNPQITNQELYNDLTNYPNIADFFVWNSNQKGALVIPRTNPTRWIGIRGYENQYTSIDLRGSLQSSTEAGMVDMHKNQLTSVEIAGCHQIKTLDLSDNLLSSEMVENVLKQMDEFGPTITSRNANLSKNSPITAQGRIYKANLEAKGWNIIVDYPTSTDELNNIETFSVYPNPTNGKFHIRLKNMPSDGVIVEIRNILGQKVIDQKAYDNDTEWSVNQFQGKMFFITLRGSNILETKRIILQ